MHTFFRVLMLTLVRTWKGCLVWSCTMLKERLSLDALCEAMACSNGKVRESVISDDRHTAIQ